MFEHTKTKQKWYKHPSWKKYIKWGIIIVIIAANYGLKTIIIITDPKIEWAIIIHYPIQVGTNAKTSLTQL